MFFNQQVIEGAQFEPVYRIKEGIKQKPLRDMIRQVLDHVTIHEWLSKSEITEPVWDDYMEYDQDFCLGLATILKKVIEEAEEIQMTACDDFDSVTYLLYSPSYPWCQRQCDFVIFRRTRNVRKRRVKVCSL